MKESEGCLWAISKFAASWKTGSWLAWCAGTFRSSTPCASSEACNDRRRALIVMARAWEFSLPSIALPGRASQDHPCSPRNDGQATRGATHLTNSGKHTSNQASQAITCGSPEAKRWSAATMHTSRVIPASRQPRIQDNHRSRPAADPGLLVSKKARMSERQSVTPTLPSRFGFGTSGIMGAALTRSGRLRLLEAALEHGIHHFDTAPLYGQGVAETLVGHFARSRRDRLTITTKFGLLPPQHPALLKPLIPLARVVNRRLLIPLQRRSTVAAARPAATPPVSGISNPAGEGAAPTRPAIPAIAYTPAMLRSQLERSLRHLGSDYIDYYLLHECHVDYLNQGFIDCLKTLVQEGKIRHYGIGSGRWQSRCILESYSALPWVVQIPDRWSDLDTEWFRQRGTAPLFTHSSLRLSQESGDSSLHGIAERWAALTDQDPKGPGLVNDFLLTVALIKNPTGCVIFSSSKPGHIRNNVLLLQRAAGFQEAAGQMLQEATTKHPSIHG